MIRRLERTAAWITNNQIRTARSFDTQVSGINVTANAGGYRYKQARRPELYKDIIGQPHVSNQKVSWMDPELSQNTEYEHLVRRET